MKHQVNILLSNTYCILSRPVSIRKFYQQPRVNTGTWHKWMKSENITKQGQSIEKDYAVYGYTDEKCLKSASLFTESR